MQKINSFIFSAFIYCLSCTLVFAQNAALLPNAQQVYLDANGNPLSSGTVTFYFPSTSNLKAIFQDAGETTPYTNPVTLNAAGRPPGSTGIYGQGAYRQLVKDSNGNIIWDAVTSSAGSASTSVATGDGDLVGTVKPWAGIVAPNQYQFAFGQQLSRTTFSALFTAITQVSNVVCANGSNTLTGVADTTQIPIGAAIEAPACVVPGTTVSSKTVSTVVMSNPASVNLNSTAMFFPFGNGDGSTTFTVPDFRGNVIAGRPNMGGTASSNLTNAFCTNIAAQGAICGAQSTTLARANLPNLIFSPTFAATNSYTPGTINLNQTVVTPGVTYGFSGAGNNFTNITANVTLPSYTPTGNISQIQLNGNVTQTAFSTVQPTMALNYIIKVTPDTNSAIATGVTSLGAMTGDIACGNGLLCTGNVISVVGGGGGGTPGGSNTQVQFNNGGLFAGSAALTWVNPNLTIGVAGTTTGQLSIAGLGSGVVQQTVQATAGNPLITWGNTSGTPATNTTAPLSINTSTGNISCSTCAITTNPLSQFAATTSAQLASVLSDETGNGLAVFSTSPTLVTPIIGAATATSINGLTLTSSTGIFTLVNGKTFTTNNSLTLAGTDSTTITFQGTDTYIGRTTTDTFTNKTLDTAGTGNTFKINGTTITAIGGNTATVGTTAGVLVSGHCVSIDANLNFIDAGGACTTGGGGGTVNSATSGQIAYYGSTGTVVSGNANLTISAGAITMGVAGSVQGSLKLAGATSGTTTLAVAAAASGTLTLPSATDTIVGRNTTDTLTNKTINTATGPNVILFNTADAGNSLKINGTAITSISGNTAKLASTSGTLTNNDCASFDASGNVVDSGGTCITSIPFTILPQGRLTVTSNTPVMTVSANAQSTLYYDCYNGGRYVPYFDGSKDQIDSIGSCQVSTAMVSAASAGQAVNNNLYDVWWVHGGASRICLAMSASSGGGGGWSSDTAGNNTARGTGYSQLDKTSRPYLTNANLITNCFNAAVNYGPVNVNQATYLGTIYTTANGQTGMNFRAGSTGGSNPTLGVYNAYNRISISSFNTDTTTNWTYNSTTWRHLDGSATNSISFIDGLGQSYIIGNWAVTLTMGAITGEGAHAGIGIDWASGIPDYTSTLFQGNADSVGGTINGTGYFNPGVGFHQLFILEASQNNTGANTMYGGSGWGATLNQPNYMQIRLEM